MIVNFRNDYWALGHQRILQAMVEHGQEINDPYGIDEHSKEAAYLICSAFGAKGAEVHFLAGGTQTNMAFLSYALKDYEAVVCCDSGHINVHETGAIEGSGHKVVPVPGVDGKLTPSAVLDALRRHGDEHMVKIKAVYISDSTETGTIYSLFELRALRELCDEYDLYLYLDGARLGAALTAEENDVPTEMLGSLCDAFYVGGTKNGLPLGEALVLVNPALRKEFRYHIKNRGAMLAKGYGIGIAFEEAFRDGLYFDLAKRTNAMGKLLSEGLANLGYRLMGKTVTNQIFVLVPKDLVLLLIEAFGCEKWEDREDGAILRFVTSFLTSEDDVHLALEFMEKHAKP